MSDIRFDEQVVIVTGAGAGLGRSHALEFARRGARVVVNDLGGAVDGTGGDESAAEKVAREITEAGGEAMAHGASVTDEAAVADMVEQTLSRWGRIDVLVNNAGILRDKSFSKMSLDDFRAVLDVHLMGSVTCTKAVWDHMKERNYGRIVFTSSTSGLYGNFGQANYGAAKMGLVGLMNVLHLEAAKYDIRINTLSPTAGTRMTEGLFPEEAFRLFNVESVSAAAVYLAGPEAPRRMIMSAGAGNYAITRINGTEGAYLVPEQQTAEGVADHIEAITAEDGQQAHEAGTGQFMPFLNRAAAHHGIKLG